MYYANTLSQQQQLPITPSNMRATRSPPAHPPQGPSPAVFAPQDTSHNRVFRYVRHLSGIVGFEYTPSTMTAAGSALSPAANHSLWAHGYQPGSIRLIQGMYKGAEDMSTFVNELANTSIPIAEGRYIFSLIRGTQ